MNDERQPGGRETGEDVSAIEAQNLRAKRALERDTLSLVIIDVLGADDLVRSVALLHPVHHLRRV